MIHNDLKKNGFSLLELLVVVALIGIIALFTVPNINSWSEARKAEKDLSAGVTYILNTDFDRRTHGAIGTGLTKSGQYFSFPSTGIYWINFRSETKIDSTQSSRYRVNSIWTTNDNSSYTDRASNSAIPGLNSHTYSMNETSYIFDVVNTSLDKFY